MTPVSLSDPSVVTALERLARTELSRGARLGHVVLALVASTMTTVVVALWLTEPVLPARTSAAFGLLTVIGLGWAAYSIWVLRARRVVLARQRVVAGRLAFAFTGVFAAGCLVLGLTTTIQAARPAIAMSLGLLVVALWLWRRAEASHARLLARRETLGRNLAGGAR
jgi:hypothetical protein